MTVNTHPARVPAGAEPTRFLTAIAGIDAVNGLDPTEVVYDRYGTLAIEVTPISIFVDERGVVTRLYNGQLDRDQMREFIEAALASPS